MSPSRSGFLIDGLRAVSGGHCIDAQDHVLLLNRQDVLDGELNAGRLAPLMIELDPDGKVVHSWGDPNLIEGTVAGLRNGPTAFRLHTCQFDKDGNVWIASSPGGMMQKYTHDGSKLLQQIGNRLGALKQPVLCGAVWRPFLRRIFAID